MSGIAGKETRKVLWEWLPGIVAGVMPLAVFLIVFLFAAEPLVPSDHPNIHEDGLVAHLLILAIVTSTYGTFTALPKIIGSRTSGNQNINAVIALFMLNTLLLLFSAAIYTIHEQHQKHPNLLLASALAAGSILVITYYLEVAVANLRLSQEGGISPQPTGAGA